MQAKRRYNGKKSDYRCAAYYGVKAISIDRHVHLVVAPFVIRGPSEARTRLHRACCCKTHEMTFGMTLW
jgi:hypothetical protein